MKLSLIIPIYKVEPYIYKCLESIYAQYSPSYSLEVILVNDGTPDNSMVVIQPLLDKMPYVQVINQQNQGLSIARNNGLREATGEYIWFIDSDDWLLPNALADVFAVFSRYKDVPVFSTVLEIHEEGKDKPYPEYSPKRGIMTGKQYLDQRYRQGASQRFIFKKSFLVDNQLTFCPGILHEDGLFGFKMLYLASHVCILVQPVYAYRIRKEGSIMSSITIRTPENLLFIHKELVQFSNDYVLQADSAWFRKVIFTIIRNLFSFSKYIISTEEFSAFYRKNKAYINQEASFFMHSEGGFLEGLRIRFMPILYWRVRVFLKNLLKK